MLLHWASNASAHATTPTGPMIRKVVRLTEFQACVTGTSENTDSPLTGSACLEEFLMDVT